MAIDTSFAATLKGFGRLHHGMKCAKRIIGTALCLVIPTLGFSADNVNIVASGLSVSGSTVTGDVDIASEDTSLTFPVEVKLMVNGFTVDTLLFGNYNQDCDFSRAFPHLR